MGVMLKDIKKLFGKADEPQLSPEEELIKQLDLLFELQTQEANLSKPYQERYTAMSERYLTPILEEQAKALGDLPEKILGITNRCKALGVEVGQNVFGSELKAEYVSGRDQADVKGLLGYAIDHPGVKEFLSKGEPSVRIKAISKNERKKLEQQRAE